MEAFVRRFRIRTWCVLALVTMTFAGCGEVADEAIDAKPDPEATSTHVGHQAGMDMFIVRVESSSGPSAQDRLMGREPWWLLMGNGDLILHGMELAFYPGPALPNLRVIHLADDDVQRILREAESAGLLDGDRQLDDSTGAPDATWTTVTTMAEGRTSTVATHALAAHSEFESFAFNIPREYGQPIAPSGAEPGTPYDIKGLRLIVQPTGESEPSGNTPVRPDRLLWPLDISPNEFGMPLDGLPAGSRCGVVTGQDLERMLAALNQASLDTQFESDEGLYTVINRILMPDEDPAAMCGAHDG